MAGTAEYLQDDAMKPTSAQLDQPDTNNTIRVAFEDGIPTASVQVHGDKWCTARDRWIDNVVDNSPLLGERSVFGFALME